MKRWIITLIALSLILYLVVPAFARGPGWGKGSGMTGYWGGHWGGCRQADGFYERGTPWKRGAPKRYEQNRYEEFSPGVPMERGYGRGFVPPAENPGHGTRGTRDGFGMGWWK